MKRLPNHLKVDDDITLRLLSEADVLPLFVLVDTNRAYLRQWLAWVDSTNTPDDERSFVQSVEQQYRENLGLTCGIWYQRHLVGTIGYHMIEWRNRRVEIGYMLDASFQGRGIMTRACQAMIELAFNILELNKVEIRCASANLRSRAIPQRLGFQQEGVIRQAEWLYDHFDDMILYGLLASEWKAQQ